MGYVKRIVCLANSLKDGGLCIAGREVLQGGFGGWIRPVGTPPHAELTYLAYRYADGSGPALLDLIDVPLLERMPNGHQTENHVIDGSRGWTKIGRCSFSRLSVLVERPATLWSNSSHTASGKLNCIERSEAAAEQTSLLLVDGTGLAVCVMPGRTGQKSFWGEFTLGGHLYKLCVTDPAVRDHFGTLPFGRHAFPESGKIFLTISLTEPYEGDGRCHKLIAAVLSEHPLAPS